MKKNNRRLVAIVAVSVLVGTVVLSVAIGEGRKTYRVEPEITVPEYKDDTARAIDAYERLMERYMDITEKNMLSAGDIQALLGKLDAVNSKLDELSTRMARIEKALGITPPPVLDKYIQMKSAEQGSPAKLPAAGAGRDSAGGTIKKESPAQSGQSIRR